MLFRSGNQGGNTGGNTGTTKTPLEQIKEASVSAPTAGTNYLLVMYQGKQAKTLYVTGEQKTGTETFLITTADKASAGIVTTESANGGFYLKVTKSGGSSQYLSLYNNTEKKKVNVKLVDDAASATVWTTNAAKILIGQFENKSYSLGTYNDYDTIGAVDDKRYSAQYDTDEYVTRLIPAGTTIGGDSGNTGNIGGDSGNQGNQGGSTTGGELTATLTVSSEAELRAALTRGANTNVYKGNGIEISNGCDTDPLNPGLDQSGQAIAVWKEMRYYANSSFTIKYGSAMTKIVITFTNDKLTDAGQVTVSGATATLSGKQLILTFNSPVTEITVKTTKQIRATVVEVYC